MRKPLQLTDDGIQDFLNELVKYLEFHPATFDEKGEVTGDGYDHLSDFVFSQLENYSNGYINFN